MSLFGNIQLTNKGLELQAKAQVGKLLNFKAIKIGDGKIGSTPISTMSDLKNYRLTIELNKFKTLNDGQAVIGGVLTNNTVVEGFYWCEIGLYAEDPDTGAEVLYAYANCGDLAEFIPANDGSTIIEKVVNIVIVIDNMENVSASINQSLVFIDREEFDKFKETVAPIIYVGDIALVDGENTTLEEGTYYVSSLSVNGVKDDKFYHAIVRVYTAANGWTYISILASNNMVQQGYNFYNVGYDGSTWSVYSVEVAKKEHTHNYVSKTGDTMAGYLTIGSRVDGSTVGSNSFAHGSTNTASGSNTYANGYNASASGDSAFASGQYVSATGKSSHAIGQGTSTDVKITASGVGATAVGKTNKYNLTASGAGSFAGGGEGNSGSGSKDQVVSGGCSFAYGMSNTVSGGFSGCFGLGNNVISNNSFAEGKDNTAGSSNSGTSWWSAHAEGNGNTASGYCSHVEGRGCIASGRFQHVIGRWNEEGTAISSDTATTGDVFIVGKGTSSSARSNAMRLTIAGKLYLCSTYSSSGADYAEITEWTDGNSNNEDRVGRFVCMEGEKMRFANSKDIRSRIGVVSAEPAILGDSYSEEWRGKYKTDVFGRKLTQTVTYEPEYDEEGNLVHDGGSGEEFILSEEYDETQKYVRREDRQEYDYFGMLGKLIVIDDGTCEVGGYCYPNDDAIATAELDENKGFYVMSRIDETHIKILLR